QSEEGTPGRILSLSHDATTSGIHLVPVNLSIAVLARKIRQPRWGIVLGYPCGKHPSEPLSERRNSGIHNSP
ncbi:MAG: hypothetical protein AB2564_06430, partial [Candidatus Thiodiazotropha sp.]